MEELEAKAFIASIFLCTTEGRKPLTAEEAEYTLSQWKEDGIDIPNGVTPEFFATEWNKMIKED